jgi:hypothetical protein
VDLRRHRRTCRAPPANTSIHTNNLPAFLDASYVRVSGGNIPAQTLIDDYRGFCAQRGEQPLDHRTKVVPFLRRQGLKDKHTKKGGIWLGLAPRPGLEGDGSDG